MGKLTARTVGHASVTTEGSLRKKESDQKSVQATGILTTNKIMPSRFSTIHKQAQLILHAQFSPFHPPALQERASHRPSQHWLWLDKCRLKSSRSRYPPLLRSSIGGVHPLRMTQGCVFGIKLLPKTLGDNRHWETTGPVSDGSGAAGCIKNIWTFTLPLLMPLSITVSLPWYTQYSGVEQEEEKAVAKQGSLTVVARQQCC